MRVDRPPSSTYTDAPLRPKQSSTLGRSRARHSTISIPHLKNHEHPCSPEEEAQRSKLSWIIFGFFCILPPLMMLYRWYGDSVISWLTRGRFGTAAILPKRVALYAGIPLNILIVTAIIVPIIILSASA
jgi:hypothetical protein